MTAAGYVAVVSNFGFVGPIASVKAAVELTVNPRINANVTGATIAQRRKVVVLVKRATALAPTSANGKVANAKKRHGNWMTPSMFWNKAQGKSVELR